MVDALTTVKTYLAITSAYAQMQSSHWLMTTILVKVNTGHIGHCKDNVKCQQLVAHTIVVLVFWEKTLDNTKIELSKRVKDDCLGRFLASPTDKRQCFSLADYFWGISFKIFLVFIKNCRFSSTAFDLAVKLPSLDTSYRIWWKSYYLAENIWREDEPINFLQIFHDITWLL